MTNYRSARACAVKPLRLLAQPLRALGLDPSARPSKEGCRDMNAGTCSKIPPLGKKESKEEALLATAKALDERPHIRFSAAGMTVYHRLRRPAAEAVWGISDPRETSLHCSTWPSFDHLVGAGKQRCWYGEAKGFRGLEIDHQFERRALLDGEVSRLSSLENFSDIYPHLPK